MKRGEARFAQHVAVAASPAAAAAGSGAAQRARMPAVRAAQRRSAGAVARPPPRVRRAPRAVRQRHMLPRAVTRSSTTLCRSGGICGSAYTRLPLVSVTQRLLASRFRAFCT